MVHRDTDQRITRKSFGKSNGESKPSFLESRKEWDAFYNGLGLQEKLDLHMEHAVFRKMYKEWYASLSNSETRRHFGSEEASKRRERKVETFRTLAQVEGDFLWVLCDALVAVADLGQLKEDVASLKTQLEDQRRTLRVGLEDVITYGFWPLAEAVKRHDVQMWVSDETVREEAWDYLREKFGAIHAAKRRKGIPEGTHGGEGVVG